VLTALGAAFCGGCRSSQAVVSVDELKAPLFANPDTSIFGPNAGTKSYDDAQIVMTDHAAQSATIARVALQREGAIGITGVFLVAPQGGATEPPAGVEVTPFLSSNGTPVKVRLPRPPPRRS
jgi:hypothetical protein